jgi:hypothetical protein
MGVSYSTHGRDENILVGKLEGKRALVRRRRRWEDNIKIDVSK